MTNILNIKSLWTTSKGFFIVLFFLFTYCSKPQKAETNFKLAFGEKIFSDQNISYNKTKSCASCHNPSLAFTDGYRTSITSGGEHLKRNAPTLLYLKGNNFYNYADSTIKTLTSQHLKPLFSQHPVELGTDSIAFIKYINSSTTYASLLSKHNHNAIYSMAEVIDALAVYIESLTLYTSAYDQFLKGDTLALNTDEKMGMQSFNSERIGCTNCHTGINFTKTNLSEKTAIVYPKNHWNYLANNNPVKIPTLRNIEVTGPYLSDGSANSILEILNKYDVFNQQNSTNNTPLTDKEKQQLIAFLYALIEVV